MIKIMCFVLHIIMHLRLCQRKVLSLVLAVIHEPELIFLDDITGGMDIESLNKYVHFSQYALFDDIVHIIEVL